MKANVKILMVVALTAGACSSGTHLSTGYDDLYYTPGDEPVATVTEVTREVVPERDTRVVNAAAQQDVRYAWEEYGVTPNDTIYFEDFYVVGRDTFAYEQVHHAQQYYADGHVSNIYNIYDPNQYYWSTRMRRFHSDYYYGGYYDPFHTDFYWRSLNRYHFGISWGWHSPFYSPFHYSPWHSSFYYGYSPWHYSPWRHNYHWGWYGMHYPYYGRYAWYPHTYWGHYGYYGYASPVRGVAYHTGHRRASGTYIGAGRGGGIGGYTPSGVTGAYGRRTETTAAPGSRRTDGTGVSQTETGSDRRAAVGTTTRPAETGTRPAGTTTRPAGTTTRPAGTTTRPAGTTTRPAGTTTRPAGTTTRPAGTTTRPAGTTTRPAGTTTRPAGTTTRPAGTTTRPAGTTTRPAGTTTRPAGTTTRPAGTTTRTSGGRDEAGTVTQQQSTPTYTRPAPGDRITYNRSSINYQTRSAPPPERTSTTGSSTYTRPTSSATYNRPDSRTSGTSGSSVRTAAPPPQRPASTTRTGSPGTTSRPAVSSGTSSGGGGAVSSGTSTGSSSGGGRGSGGSGGRR